MPGIVLENTSTVNFVPGIVLENTSIALEKVLKRAIKGRRVMERFFKHNFE